MINFLPWLCLAVINTVAYFWPTPGAFPMLDWASLTLALLGALLFLRTRRK